MFWEVSKKLKKKSPNFFKLTYWVTSNDIWRFFFHFFVAFSEYLNFITQSVTLCIIFHNFFSFFCRSTLKKHDLCSQNVRRSCWDRAGGLGARPPSPGIWYTPTPLTAFHVWSWIHRGGPILLSELGLTSGRLWYNFCKYLPGGFFYEILCPHFKVLKCRKIVGS